MVAPSVAILDKGDAGIEAAEGTVVPRILHGAESCLAIESTVGTRAIPSRLKTIKDALAPLARIRPGMFVRTTDDAPVLGHVGLISQHDGGAYPTQLVPGYGLHDISAQPVLAILPIGAI